MLNHLLNLPPQNSDQNILVFVKGLESYIFSNTNENRDKCLQVLGKFAADKKLSFNWKDFTVLSAKIRKAAEAYEKMPTYLQGRF